MQAHTGDCVCAGMPTEKISSLLGIERAPLPSAHAQSIPAKTAPRTRGAVFPQSFHTAMPPCSAKHSRERTHSGAGGIQGKQVAPLLQEWWVGRPNAGKGIARVHPTRAVEGNAGKAPTACLDALEPMTAGLEVAFPLGPALLELAQVQPLSQNQ